MHLDIFILAIGVISAFILALIFYRVHVTRISTTLNTHFERLLKESTLATEQRCEKLLRCVEDSKGIAKHALAESHPERLRRALGEISELLDQVHTR
jgi:hypothetical protein